MLESIQPFQSLCQSSRAAFIVNVIAVVMQSTFILSLLAYMHHQTRIEEAASQKNPVAPLLYSLLWGTCIATIVFATIATLQGIRLMKKRV